MIKLGLKNYFKSFRFFFVPLGALSLGIVAGLSIAIPMIWAAIKAFVSGVAELMGQLTWDWGAVKDVLIAELESFNWADLDGVAQQVTGDGYLGDLLIRCAEAALGDTSSIQASFEELVSKTVGTISLALIFAVVLSVIGALVGYFVTSSQIRNAVAKRSFWRGLLASLADAVIKVTLLVFAVWLIGKLQKYAILAFLLVVILYGAISFFEAYLVHGIKKVPFSEVMNLKNFFALTLLTLIEFVIAALMVAFVYKIGNQVIGAYVAYSIFVITIICVQLNAEAYVKSLADMDRAAPPDPAAIAAAYSELAPGTRVVKEETPDLPAAEQSTAEESPAEPSEDPDEKA